MLDFACRRTRQALVCVASLVALVLSVGAADAKPKPKPVPPEEESDDIELVDATPKKGKGKKDKKAESKKAENQKTASKTGGGKKKPPPEPDSDDVVMTTTTADGTKIEQIELEEDESLAAPPQADEAEEPSAAKLNWAGLSLQQDTIIFTSTSGVCRSVDENGVRKPGNEQYSCRDNVGVYPSPVYSGGGNQVSGGLGFATTRVMVGYDRLFIHRLLVGARVGYAFRQAPAAEGVESSLPFHAEVRGAFYLRGQRPFEAPGLRPFVSFGLGVAQVDALVPVDFYKDQPAFVLKDKKRLHAWRRTGIGFAAPGGGASYAIKNLMINAELRIKILFPATAIAPALNLGASYGF
jgi:hypothetical protein